MMVQGGKGSPFLKVWPEKKKAFSAFLEGKAEAQQGEEKFFLCGGKEQPEEMFSQEEERNFSTYQRSKEKGVVFSRERGLEFGGTTLWLCSEALEGEVRE